MNDGKKLLNSFREFDKKIEKMEELLERATAEEAVDIQSKIDRLEIRKKEILDGINAVEDKDFRTLLMMRFVEGKKWKTIAEKLGRSLVGVQQKFFDKSVKEFEKVMGLKELEKEVMGMKKEENVVMEVEENVVTEVEKIEADVKEEKMAPVVERKSEGRLVRKPKRSFGEMVIRCMVGAERAALVFENDEGYVKSVSVELDGESEMVRSLFHMED